MADKKKNRRYGLMGILSLVIIYLVVGCIPNVARPFDYPPAKWVSESGDFWFVYTGDEERENPDDWPNLDGGYMIGGESHKCKVRFAQYHEGICFYEENEEEPVFLASCVFGPEKIKVRVVSGKYKGDKKITFIRYPLETESEEKDTEIR